MKVGIIGAGTMGSGIAQAFAQTEGYEVYLCDINEEFAANGKKKIAAGLEKRVAKGKMDQAAADAILNKIHTGVKDICTDCDLVVEAALEVMAVKQQTFKELETICKNPDVIFADEPSGSLDSHNKEELHRLFFDLRDRFNQTFVIVTHDEGLAAMCDRTLKMRDGRIIDQTTNNQQCDDCQ